jgi:transposase
MNKTPRSPAFKKKVALEAIKEERPINEIAQTYGIHPVQVCQWKKTLLDGAESIFTMKKKKTPDPEAERAILERKIGQLSVENDWLKKKLGA